LKTPVLGDNENTLENRSSCWDAPSMEVGEMIFAPLFVVLVIASGWWAWGYQQQAVRVLRVRPSSVEHHARRVAATDAKASAALDAASGTARVAVRQLERIASPAPSSVLGWDAFSIISTLVFDGTVLIGCRRQADPLFLDSGFDRRRDEVEDNSMVLLIGEDERAAQAVALLEGWRAAAATLNLRPTGVEGAIELFDGRANALRAGLLAA
jgi:hypothetical protein